MAAIPALINGVTVEFSPNVNNDVDPAIVRALQHVISTGVAPGHTLLRIYISSATDQHTKPSQKLSRHNQKKAVDISRINGVRMITGYGADASIKAIVDAMQDTFETFPGRRENFGPKFIWKLGAPHKDVSSHNDHVHFSVN
jgi:hypothetical protein